MNKTPRYLAGFSLATLALAVIVGCGKQSASSTTEAPSAAATTAAATAPQAGYTLSASGLTQADGTPVQLNAYTQGADGKWRQGVVATTQVRGGKFSLSGPAVTTPAPGLLQVGNPHDKGAAFISLIVENASYTVSGHGAALVVQGGHYNDLVFGYTHQADYQAAVAAKDAAEREIFKHVAPGDDKAMLQAKMDAAPVLGPHYIAMGKIAGAYLVKIIDGQYDDLAKFYAMINNPDPESLPPARREALMAGFAKTLADNPEYQSMKVGEAMEAQAEAARNALAIGKPYRDITVADKDGHEMKLSDVLKKNKFVLVDFWASWCAPCRAEFPYLSKVYRDYHAAGFEIYGVSLDEERGDWLKAMKQESDNGHLPWINLRANGFASAAAQAYGVRALPNNYLIARDGRIVGKELRGADVERIVAEQLGKTGHGQD